MNLTTIISNMDGQIASLVRSNPFIAVVALIVLAFFIYRRPKFFLTLFLIGVLIMGVFYVVSSLSTSGSAKKERLIEKSAPEESFGTQRPRI